ncbi:Intraflagellar transport protein 80, partial [Coelomomyces lativittatus]
QASVSCISWSPVTDELFSFGEDQKCWKWSREGGCVGEFSTSLFSSTLANDATPIYFTCINWFPGKSDFFAIGNSEGKIFFCGKSGRTEKVLEAHRNAVLCLAWNTDGSALLSGGEDGSIKIWSKAGMLRSVMVTQCANRKIFSLFLCFNHYAQVDLTLIFHISLF